MRANVLATTLAAAALCVGCAAWLRWARAAPLVAQTRLPIPSTSSRAAIADSALADAEEFAVTNDPFRLSNTPSRVRYDPANDGGASGSGAPMPPSLRPVLVLKAIIGGPPWQAVIDGIPGQPSGTIATQGARFDRLTIRAITRDSVVVQGPDTSWVLNFRGRS